MDFKSALQNELLHLNNKYGLSNPKSFLFWFAREILEIDDDAVVESISVDGANDKGIDLLYIDDENSRVFIVQGKYSASLNYTPKEKEVSVLESSLNWLSNPEALERDGKPELAEAAKEYIEAINNGYSVELIFVYAGSKAQNIEKKIQVYNQNPDNLEKNRMMRLYNVELLEELWEEIQGGRRRIEEGKINISGEHFIIKGKFGEAIVATVPCGELVRLYKEHQDKLFDRNVRLFLGARKGSVNAGIAKTIQDENERGFFWAYNNGITIICDAFEPPISDQLVIRNFSIVNGCQTTVSLADNNGDNPDLTVLVRCIAASSEIIDDIIQFTNSQNPIKPWDLASQDRTQRRLKSEFSKLPQPYVYFTRRGDKSFVAEKSKYKDKHNKLRIIPIDLAGQYMAAFKGNPYLAYKHKAFVFQAEHRNRLFPPDISVEEVLFCWICGEICKDVVATTIKDQPNSVRILRKGGTLFVLAATSEILSERNGANFLIGLKQVNIDSNRMKERLKKYAKYAVLTYLNAVQDEATLRNQELAVLIRQPEFVEKVLVRVKTSYRKDALNEEWLKGVLPKVGEK